MDKIDPNRCYLCRRDNTSLRDGAQAHRCLKGKPVCKKGEGCMKSAPK